MSDLTVERLAQGPILTCSPRTSLVEATRRMYAARCSSIVVVEGGEAVGIWTEKDILAIDLGDAETLTRPIGDVMSKPVKTVAASCDLCEATRRMKEERVRHFLVVNGTNEPIGILSQTDIVLNHGIEYFLHMRKVRSALMRMPLSLPHDMALTEAAARLRRADRDAAAVTYPDGSIGIVTERDVVRLVCEQRVDVALGEIASRPLITIAEDASLYSARAILAEHHVRHLGVVDDRGALVTLLSFADILNTVETGYIQDLRATLKQREEALTLSRGRLRLAGKVFESTVEGIVITDADGIIQSSNPAFRRLTGYAEDEMVGQNARMFSSGRQTKDFYRAMWEALKTTGHWKGEIWNRKKNGEIFLKTMTITGISDNQGNYSNFAAVHSDVISHEENADRIHYLANYDALTGLPNRSHFNDHLSRAITESARRRISVGVLVLDIDRFRTVNESLGYLAGDELLQAVAALLMGIAGEDVFIARLNADEFGLVASSRSSATDFSHLASRLLACLTTWPVTIRDCRLYLTASIGIAMCPADGADASRLLQRADLAVGQAKAGGRNTYRFFATEMNDRARRRISLDGELRRALERGEFELHYQPKLDINDMVISGAEALVRWRHPERGLLPPSEFIPAAEELGLIADINLWVLDVACRQARAWQRQALPPLSVAVNLSSCQFRQRDLTQLVSHLLSNSGLQPDCLELEITETMAMEHGEETFRTLADLVSAGVSVSIDDFGTGYSCFSYLKRYPVTSVKIDRSFIQDLHKAEDVAIPRAMISMAHALGMSVVAEGIETEFQLATMRACGCNVGQGFLFSKPLPANDFHKFCTAHFAAQSPAVPALRATP